MAIVTDALQRESEYSIYELVTEAVQRFSEKLNAIQRDDETKQIIPLLGDDISKHAESASVLLERMQYAHAGLREFLKENSEIIRYALTYYIKDTESADELLQKKLLGVKLELTRSVMEIRLAKEILSELPARASRSGLS